MMRRIHVTLLLIVLNIAVGVSVLAAPDGAVREIVSTDIARSTDNICAMRDKFGFLWVGTTTGLSCFDGNGVPVYPNHAGTLRSTENLSVSSLFESGENLWFGGTIGLYVFDREKNRASQFPYKTNYGVRISSRVEKILDAGQNRIWICTLGQGVFIFNTADNTLVQDSRHGSFYPDAVLGSNGLVYLASLKGQIQTFRPDGEFLGSVNLPGYVMDKNSIVMASYGNDVWIASGANLYRYNIGSSEVTHEILPAAVGNVNTILSRSDNGLLLGAASGLWLYEPSNGSVSKVQLANSKGGGHSDPRIVALAYDTDGNIIIVNPSGGISFLLVQEPAFDFVQLPAESDAYNLVNAISPDTSGKGLWIGADNGLTYFDLASRSFTPVGLPFIGPDAVKSITARADSLWIGTSHSGLMLHNAATGATRRFTYDQTVPYTVISNDINDVYCTRNGETFILTDWGMCRYNPESDNFHQLTEIGQQTQVVTMQEDRQGRLWAATASEGVLFRPTRNGRFVPFDSKVLGRQPVTMMLLDSRGTLWVATLSNGVYTFNEAKNEFEHIDIPIFTTEPITLLEEDAEGKVWIGSSNILAQLDGENNIRFFKFGRYSDVSPVHRSSALMPNGEIAVGCRNGFMTFQPKKMLLNESMIKVYPRSLSFPYVENNSEEVESMGLDLLLYTQKRVEIPFDNNSFTIHLAASHPSDMPQVRYDYMLSGIDKGWVTGVGSPEVTYNNLPPGDYEFLVRPSGVKNGEVSRLALTVLPPWYRTTLAYIVYALLFIVFGWFVFIVVRRRVRRHYRHRIDEMRIQQEREVFESKTRYFVDLVHEIRTPLMLISLPLEQIAENMREDGQLTGEKAPRYIHSMQRNLDYLLGITNQLLDFRKAENNSEIQLNLRRCDLNELLSEICRRFEEPLAADNKKITLTLPDTPTFVTFDAVKTERLLMNLIGNAMKYSRHEVDVKLVTNSDGEVSVSVADDGPGVPANEREKIFDTYYQIGNDNVAASLGTGLGLAYAKLIAVAHHGNITVSDSPGGGALFTITLPKGDDVAETVSPEMTGFDEPLPEAVSDETAAATTILVVEDNKELQNMITEALSRRFKVLTASNGVEALKVLASKDVKIIVSDVMMPRMDGMELCRRVKNDVNYSHIPFIILTAKTSHEAHEEGMQCGADVYLEKPFPIRQLMYQIANLLRTRQLFYERMRSANPLVPAKSGEKTEPVPALNRYDAEFLEKMNGIITENISDEDFSIDMLAERLNMSRSSFYRKITAVVGMPPGDYLKTFRLNYAVRLLCDGCRVTEVASNVGFTSSSYFAKCFRDKFGVLPSEYVASRC